MYQLWKRKSYWIIGNIRIYYKLWKNCYKITLILHWYGHNIFFITFFLSRKLILVLFVPIISLKASLMYSNTNETRSRKVYFILTRERFLFVRNLISQLIIRYLHKLKSWTWSSTWTFIYILYSNLLLLETKFIKFIISSD